MGKWSGDAGLMLHSISNRADHLYPSNHFRHEAPLYGPEDKHVHENNRLIIYCHHE
jgi:hypothetical protein